jgi:hypothetical protein
MQVRNGASPFHGTIQYADFTHELAFTRQSVVYVLSAAGFMNMRVYLAGSLVHAVLSAVRWII